MSNKKLNSISRFNLNTNYSSKISSIIKMQSIPEEVVLKLLNAKGRLKKEKKGMLRIVK